MKPYYNVYGELLAQAGRKDEKRGDNDETPI